MADGSSDHGNTLSFDTESMADLTINTPDESVADTTAAPSLPTHQYCVPEAGETYIITCRETGKALTLLEGNVCLAHQNGEGSVRWTCTETDGYLGFRNPVSGCWLGRDAAGSWSLGCTQQHHKGWEFFTLRPVPGGGFKLMHMRHDNWYVLDTVGIKRKDNNESLAILSPGQSNTEYAIVWKFERVLRPNRA